jgi:sarcosine oxidase
MKVIIVGGGIVGLSTAWALTKRGHQVTLIERGQIPNPMAASGDHHRIMRRAYSAASGYAPTITEAFEAWDSVWEDIGANYYDARGFLLFSHYDGDDADVFRQGLDAGGFGYEYLKDEDWEQRFPFLNRDKMEWGVFSTEGGELHCRKIAIGLRNWLLKHGAALHENTDVTAIDTDNAVVTIADGSTLSADRVVVAAGGWTPDLIPQMHEQLIIYRTAVVYMNPPAHHAAAWAASPVILDIGGKIEGYVLPPSGGAGLKFGSTQHRRKAENADTNRVARTNEGHEMLAYFQGVIRDLDQYQPLEVVTCAYTFTHDENFTAEQHGRTLVVSACSGHGYKFGSAVGIRAADAVETGDMDGFKRWLVPARFG